MRLLLLLFAIVLLPVPVIAANWEMLNIDFCRGEGYFVDKESIMRLPDGHVRIWFKVIDAVKKRHANARIRKHKMIVLQKENKNARTTVRLITNKRHSTKYNVQNKFVC